MAEEDNSDCMAPLIPPRSPRRIPKKLSVLQTSSDPVKTSGSTDGPGGEKMKYIPPRQLSMTTDLLMATDDRRPVLGKLFATRPPRRAVERTKGRGQRIIKSQLYSLLNPRSRQWHALFFKRLISLVITIDFFVYVVSTEPIYRQHGRNAELFQTVEGITSSIFLLEYLARLYIVTESKRLSTHGPVVARLYFMIQIPSLIDLLATLPFFLKLGTDWDLPTLTFLRMFRLLRILKTNGFVKATNAVWRVIYYNREIMYTSFFVGLFMILTTSILMFYLRPRNDFKSDEFESILSTMYISTLILTGSSSVGDMPELPWYTKGVLLLTSAFSIGMFAIPVSMVTWGFEAEAARCAKRERQLAKRRLTRAVSNVDESSTDDYSTDEEYQRIIAGDEDSDNEEDRTKQAMLQFLTADADGSGSLSLQEYIKMARKSQLGGSHPFLKTSGQNMASRLDSLEEKVDAITEKLDRLYEHLTGPMAVTGADINGRNI